MEASGASSVALNGGEECENKNKMRKFRPFLPKSYIGVALPSRLENCRASLRYAIEAILVSLYIHIKSFMRFEETKEPRKLLKYSPCNSSLLLHT